MSVTQQERSAPAIGTAASATQLQRLWAAVAVVVVVAILAAVALTVTGGTEVGEYDQERALATQTARLEGLAAHHGATVVNTAEVARWEALAEYYLGQAAEVEARIADLTGTTPDGIVYGQEAEELRHAALAPETAPTVVEYEPETLRYERIADNHRAQIR